MDRTSNCGVSEEMHRVTPGLIQKSASLGGREVTDADLQKINRYALTPLEADDVFAFRAVLCDNKVDREHERFSLRALSDLQKLFLGKTVISDHDWSAGNQVARIYDTELVQSPEMLDNGEAYTQLVACCYMVKTAGNADLIAEIKGGIKREGSVGLMASRAICSICGVDNVKSYCSHYPGCTYEKDGKRQICTFVLDGARDAYEFSLVAVPAQPTAGICKHYTGETVHEGSLPKPEADGVNQESLYLRVRAAEAIAKITTFTEE